MDKITIKCPKCKGKMKVSLKKAKYKCPHCSEIYKMSYLKLALFKIENFFKAIISTFIDIKNGIKTKYLNAVSTYKYMKGLRANMKRDPNWSNYHREQREMKEADKMENPLKKIFKRGGKK